MAWKGGSGPDYHIISTLLYIPGPTSSGNITDSSKIHPNELLPYHHRRLLTAAHAHRFFGAVSVLEQPNSTKVLREQILEHLASQPNLSNQPGATDRVQHITHHYRVRVAISSSGEMTLTSTPIALSTFLYIPRHLSFDSPNLPLCQIHINACPTTPSNFTRYKTTNRCMYESALAGSGIRNGSSPLTHEVLLWNPEGEVMECTTSTVYIRRLATDVKDEVLGWSWQTPQVSSGGCDGVTRKVVLERGLCVERVIRIEDIQIGEWVWLSNAVRGFWTGLIVNSEFCINEEEHIVDLTQAVP